MAEDPAPHPLASALPQAKQTLLVSAITAATKKVAGGSAAAGTAAAVAAAAAARRKRPENKATSDKGRRLFTTRKWLMFDAHGQLTFLGALLPHHTTLPRQPPWQPWASLWERRSRSSQHSGNDHRCALLLQPHRRHWPRQHIHVWPRLWALGSGG
jgi:hypothetical protein